METSTSPTLLEYVKKLRSLSPEPVARDQLRAGPAGLLIGVCKGAQLKVVEQSGGEDGNAVYFVRDVFRDLFDHGLRLPGNRGEERREIELGEYHGNQERRDAHEENETNIEPSKSRDHGASILRVPPLPPQRGARAGCIGGSRAPTAAYSGRPMARLFFFRYSR